MISSTHLPGWYDAVGRYRSLQTRQTSVAGGESEGQNSHGAHAGFLLLSGADIQCKAIAQTIICKGQFICTANKKT